MIAECLLYLTKFLIYAAIEKSLYTFVVFMLGNIEWCGFCCITTSTLCL